MRSTSPTSCCGWPEPSVPTPRREAVNVNAFDEVPNSAWFTNRNHVRAVPVAELRQGPDSVFLPAKPWTIKHAKQGGWTSGFQIKDADGKKWLVKLDPRGYPQLSSGADMVARTLLHAAGYNVPHNEPVRFRRGDVTIDPDLLRGAEGELIHRRRPRFGARARRGVPRRQLLGVRQPVHRGPRAGIAQHEPAAARRFERLVPAHQPPRAPGSVRPVLLDQQLGHGGSPVSRHVRRDPRQPRARRALHPRRRARRSARPPIGPKSLWESLREHASTSGGPGGGS